MLLSAHMTSVLFLVRFNNFAPTRLLLELHTLTQVADSYALLQYTYIMQQTLSRGAASMST